MHRGLTSQCDKWNNTMQFGNGFLYFIWIFKNIWNRSERFPFPNTKPLIFGVNALTDKSKSTNLNRMFGAESKRE